MKSLLLLPFTIFAISCASTDKKVADKDALPEACTTACKSTFGEVLGTGATGLPAYSNCKSSCVYMSPNEINGTYSGIKWQCVEYSRRWLIANKGLTYGSVDFASDIWANINEFQSTKTKSPVPVQTVLNGSKRPPKVGDLLIYSKEFLGTGHVAVISKVTRKRVYVEEENYDNTKWKKNYARKIQMIKKRGKYWILDPYLLGWKSL